MIADGVCVMHGHIEHNAAARARIVQTPATQMFRQADRVRNLYGQNLSDPAVGDQLADRAMTACAAQMVIGRKVDACCLGRVDHFACLCQCHRQWLFAKHMFARSNGRKRLCVVFFICRRDVDRINRRVGEGLCQVCGGIRDVFIRCEVVRVFRRATDNPSRL